MVAATEVKRQRFHFLDGFRAIAVLMVVFTHSFTSNIVDIINLAHIPYVGDYFRWTMQSGVAHFFVLSGIVLLRPYLREQRKLNVGNYFLRRFKRLFSAYWVALAFAAFVIWFNNRYATWYNVLGSHSEFTWSETFRHLGIISFDGRFYNSAWWSLGIEVVFYLVVPIIIFFRPSPGKLSYTRAWIYILGGILVVFALQLFANAYFNNFYTLDYYVPSVFRALEFPVCFMVGVFLAMRDFSLKEGRIFLYLSIVFILVGGYLLHKSFLFVSLCNAGYGLLYGGIITIANHRKSFRDFLSSPLMVWLGERSYSLFLIHFSVFYLVNNLVSHFIFKRNMLYFLLTRGLGLPLALFAAMLLFHFVERKQAHGLVTANAFWPWQFKKMNLHQSK